MHTYIVTKSKYECQKFKTDLDLDAPTSEFIFGLCHLYFYCDNKGYNGEIVMIRLCKEIYEITDDDK